jgi:anti-sigma factor (TIGR02949 family)
MTPEHRHDALTVDCETVMRQLWDDLDGELTAERLAAIRAHLAVCARCYPQYEFERAFLAALARAQRQSSDPRALRTRVASALRAEGLAEL